MSYSSNLSFVRKNPALTAVATIALVAGVSFRINSSGGVPQFECFNGTGCTISSNTLNLGSSSGTGAVSPTRFAQIGSGSTIIGSGSFVFPVPKYASGWLLTAVQADVATAGTTNTTKFQIRQPDKGNRLMLSTQASIDSTELSSLTAATPYVINTANDDIHAGQMIHVDITQVSTTAAKGAAIILQFSKP